MADIDALERICRADNRLQGDLFGTGRWTRCLAAAGGRAGLSDGRRSGISATPTNCRTRRPADEERMTEATSFAGPGRL